MTITLQTVLRVAKRRLGLEKVGREWLLEMMPKHSICAEVGVYWGVFSRMILKIVHPKMLHLIDPWKFQSDPLFASTLYGGEKGQKSGAHGLYLLLHCEEIRGKEKHYYPPLRLARLPKPIS